MSHAKLWIIMPVFNEEKGLESVLNEWVPNLRKIIPKSTFIFLVLNDGSTDGSLAKLKSLSSHFPEIRVADKVNSGHGQTCVKGYRMAFSAGAEWIFQIDSDGQCDPRYFARLWARRNLAGAVFGFRKVRWDGITRLLISRMLTLVIFLRTGIWIRDPNVPYRLIRTDVLRPLLSHIPRDFYLANILLSILIERCTSIEWVDIAFRKRSSGASSFKPVTFLHEAFRLLSDLKRCKMGLK